METSFEENKLDVGINFDQMHELLDAEREQSLSQSLSKQGHDTQNDLLYGVEDDPGWCLSILLGLQHYLTMFGGSIVLPFTLASIMCYENENIVLAEMINALFFASGIGTLLQVLLGARLPIVLGGSFTYLGPVSALMSFPEYACKIQSLEKANISGTESPMNDLHMRINMIAGSIMVSSVLQIVIGFSGIIGILARFIGPMTTGPIVCLVGLHLFPVAVKDAGSNWIVSGITMALLLLFSLYIVEVPIPLPWYFPRKGYRTIWLKAFKLFPLVIAVLIGWILCAILTVSGALTNDPKDPSYYTRTDARNQVLTDAKWFKVPYPGMWGTPTVTFAGVFGMFPAVISTILGYVGDIYACAKAAEAPSPPSHAINRSVGFGGIATLIIGSFGVGTGLTTYSENIGAITITQVASRRVIVCSAFIMMLFGIIGKIGAIITTIPTPVIGGIFLVLFGLLAAVGVAIVTQANIRSVRNMTIFGVSVLAGLGIPYYMKTYQVALDTGSKEVDQILTVILSTEITVGGFFAIILDNTAPGSLEDRGIEGIYLMSSQREEDERSHYKKTYDLPLILQRLVTTCGVARFIPFLPYHAPSIAEKETATKDENYNSD